MDAKSDLRSSWVFWARNWANDPGKPPPKGTIQTHQVVVTWYDLHIKGPRPLTIPISSIRYCRIDWENKHDYVLDVAIGYSENECCLIYLVDPTGPYDIARTAKEPEHFVAVLTALLQGRGPAGIEPNPYVRSAKAKRIDLPPHGSAWDPDVAPWEYAERYWPKPWHIPWVGVPGYITPVVGVMVILLLVILVARCTP